MTEKFGFSARVRVRIKEIGRLTSGTFAVNVAASGFSLLTSMLLTRLLGPSQYGLYSYLLSISGIALVLATFGFPTLLIRETASLTATRSWSRLKGLIRRADELTLSFSVVLVAMLFLLAPELRPIAGESGFRLDLILALVFIPIGALQMLRSSVLNGMERTVQSLFPVNIVAPVLVIIGLLAIHWLQLPLSVTQVLLLQLTTALIALVALHLLQRRFHSMEYKSARPSFQLRPWLVSALPLLVNGTLMVLNMKVDIVLLGKMRGAQESGIYNAATSGAQLLILALGTLNTVFQPKISKAYALKDNDSVRSLITTLSRVGFAVAFGGATVLCLAGSFILGLMFGASFRVGATALAVLSIARMVNAGTGGVGPYLAMTGRERVLALALGFETIVNVIFNVVFIHFWGLTGSALATGGSMVLMNVLLTLWTYKTTGIDTSFLGFHKRQLSTNGGPLK